MRSAGVRSGTRSVATSSSVVETKSTEVEGTLESVAPERILQGPHLDLGELRGQHLRGRLVEHPEHDEGVEVARRPVRPLRGSRASPRHPTRSGCSR